MRSNPLSPKATDPAYPDADVLLYAGGLTHEQKATLGSEAPPQVVSAAPTTPAAEPSYLKRRFTWISTVAAVLVIASITSGVILSRHPFSNQVAIGQATAPESVYLTPTFYQSTNNEVVALDASTGRVRWRAQSGTAQAAPILDNGVLYVGSFPPQGTTPGQGGLFAFRASDGKLLWQHPLPGGITRLVVSNGIVFASIEQDGITGQHVVQAYTAAFRASDGALLWRFDQAPLRAVADGMVYINGLGGVGKDMPLYALKASDGTLQWQHPGNGPQASDTYWVVYPMAGTLYAIPSNTDFCGCSPAHPLLALDPQTGRQLWSHPGLAGLLSVDSQGVVAVDRGGTDSQV